LTLIGTGCAELSQNGAAQQIVSKPQQNKIEKPEWIYTPNQDGKLGGIGIAGSHIKGPSAQRELAISRALDEIARQMNVKVSTVVKTSSSTTKNSASNSIDTFSVQTSDGQIIKARINKIWQDHYSEEMYIWMLMQ
jgi:hypothetical protein